MNRTDTRRLHPAPQPAAQQDKAALDRAMAMIGCPNCEGLRTAYRGELRRSVTLSVALVDALRLYDKLESNDSAWCREDGKRMEDIRGLANGTDVLAAALNAADTKKAVEDVERNQQAATPAQNNSVLSAAEVLRRGVIGAGDAFYRMLGRIARSQATALDLAICFGPATLEPCTVVGRVERQGRQPRRGGRSGRRLRANHKNAKGRRKGVTTPRKSPNAAQGA